MRFDWNRTPHELFGDDGMGRMLARMRRVETELTLFLDEWTGSLDGRLTGRSGKMPATVRSGRRMRR